MADVIRVTDGPLALVRASAREPHLRRARELQDVWWRPASLRSILELTTVAQVVEGRLPDTVVAYTSRRSCSPFGQVKTVSGIGAIATNTTHGV